MEGLATTRTVAEYLKIKTQTLDAWASQGKGPRYIKVGGARRYDWLDLHAWIEENKTPADRPRWRCSTCKRPVTAGTDGHLVVSIDHAVMHGEADWGVLHDGCVAPPIPNPYVIDISTADTWPKLADWIAHLLEKDWAHNTDLTGLLRKAGASR